MKLNKRQLHEMIWIFSGSTSNGSCNVGSIHLGTLKALERRGMIQFTSEDKDRVMLTPEGEKLLFSDYHHVVIDFKLNTFGWAHPDITIIETLARVPLESLPMYLTHKDPKMRKLASKIIEERKCS